MSREVPPFFAFLYPWYYRHKLRDSVSPVCQIFFMSLINNMLASNNFKITKPPNLIVVEILLQHMTSSSPRKYFEILFVYGFTLLLTFNHLQIERTFCGSIAYTHNLSKPNAID